jgi:hypothetical protein
VGIDRQRNPAAAPTFTRVYHYFVWSTASITFDPHHPNPLFLPSDTMYAGPGPSPSFPPSSFMLALLAIPHFSFLNLLFIFFLFFDFIFF